jgi:hypothetical protein
MLLSCGNSIIRNAFGLLIRSESPHPQEQDRPGVRGVDYLPCLTGHTGTHARYVLAPSAVLAAIQPIYQSRSSGGLRLRATAPPSTPVRLNATLKSSRRGIEGLTSLFAGGGAPQPHRPIVDCLLPSGPPLLAAIDDALCRRSGCKVFARCGAQRRVSQRPASKSPATTASSPGWS